MIECEFGCGAQIYHVPVRFSDGLEILIPRESANSIHYCDFLGPDDSIGAPSEKLEQLWREWEWAVEDVFADLSGLEFKNKRQDIKEFLISNLSDLPDFYNEYYLDPRHNLPSCLQKKEDRETTDYSDHPHGIHVFELLGLFYQMDGNLEDAKKCFTLLLETANCPNYIPEKKQNRLSLASQKIDKIEQELSDQKNGWVEEEHSAMENNRTLALKEKGVRPKIQQASQRKAEYTLENVYADNKKLKEEIKQFEEEDLHNFILKKFPGKELKKKLQNTYALNTDRTLYDIFKDFAEKQEENSVLDQQSTPLSSLTLSNKNTIVWKIVKKPFFHMLVSINSRRNELAHADDTPEEFKKVRAADEIELNKKTRSEIKLIKSHFEKLRGR